MYAKRVTLALGVVCAAIGWSASANAAGCPVNGSAIACYDVPDTGLTVPFTAVSHPSSGGTSGTDEIDIIIDGPNGVASPGSGATSVLRFSNKSGLSSFSYVFTSTAIGGAPNDSGTLSTNGSDGFDLNLTATNTAGAPFSYYKLLLTWDTTGFSTGGGYSYALDFEPCTNCGNTTVPVPPAAILFVSGLAGLGLLGRRRRKAVAA